MKVCRFKRHSRKSFKNFRVNEIFDMVETDSRALSNLTDTSRNLYQHAFHFDKISTESVGVSQNSSQVDTEREVNF